MNELAISKCKDWNLVETNIVLYGFNEYLLLFVFGDVLPKFEIDILLKL